MKTKGSKLLALLCAVLIGLLPLTGCGNGRDNTHAGTLVKFWGTADNNEGAIFSKITDTYNKTNKDGITVRYEPKIGDFDSLIDKTLSGTSGPDVFYVNDGYFKRWVSYNYLTDITSYVEASKKVDLGSMWSTGVERFRYDKEKKISTPDSPVYALPKDVSPTGIFYNKSAFEKQGVIVISVDEADLEAWNGGGVRDRAGKTKEDYGIPLDRIIPAKGYYREKNAYLGGGANAWRPPQYADGQIRELCVFNNRISMSWDETEDLAMLFTRRGGNVPYKNPNLLKDDPMTYGYFTQWWFTYGWSVGGDCAEDMTGEGDWEFTLGDKDKRCIVYNPDGSYARNPRGEVIFVKEKNKHDYALSPGQYFGETLGASQYDAFSRFVYLSQPVSKGGLGVAPSPEALGASSSLAFFVSGKCAMLIEQNFKINYMRDLIGDSFEWDVCPLPHYKEIFDESGVKVADEADAAVVKEGIVTGHCGSTGLAIWTKSKVKDEAYKFVEWLSGPEAQKIQANGGFNICNQKELAYDEYVAYNVRDGQMPQNISVFVDSIGMQKPGDWWYMEDSGWIDVWAKPLNGDVRNGKLTIEEFFKIYSPLTTKYIRDNYLNG